MGGAAGHVQAAGRRAATDRSPKPICAATPAWRCRRTERERFASGSAHTHPPGYPFTLRFGDEEAKRLVESRRDRRHDHDPLARRDRSARDLNTLVNSDVVHNLCRAPDPKLFPQGIRTAWLARPGRLAVPRRRREHARRHQGVLAPRRRAGVRVSGRRRPVAEMDATPSCATSSSTRSRKASASWSGATAGRSARRKIAASCFHRCTRRAWSASRSTSSITRRRRSSISTRTS